MGTVEANSVAAISTGLPDRAVGRHRIMVVLRGEITMSQQARLYWTLAALLLLPANAVRSSPTLIAPSAPAGRVGSCLPSMARGGSAASRTLRQTVLHDKLPLEVRSFHWTHGYCRIVSDQMHASHMRREGRRLADLVLRCREEAPNRPIYLVGHSAGCGVVLTAAENLPPGSVERIVLLAPAVSIKHDLRPALACSCRGVDVFIAITTGFAWASAFCWPAPRIVAGRWRPAKSDYRPLTDPEDEAPYDKLRQYPWDASLIVDGPQGRPLWLLSARVPAYVRAAAALLRRARWQRAGNRHAASVPYECYFRSHTRSRVRRARSNRTAWIGRRRSRPRPYALAPGCRRSRWRRSRESHSGLPRRGAGAANRSHPDPGMPMSVMIDIGRFRPDSSRACGRWSPRGRASPWRRAAN